MSKVKPVALTTDDWIEVEAALSSKIISIRRGNYGHCCGEHTRRPCACDKKWIGHLTKIMRTIGLDGAKAATRGVAPSSG